MQEVRQFWKENLVKWELRRYSPISFLNPASYVIRERLSLAKQELEAELAKKPDAKVLELGCGSGIMLKNLNLGYYQGVDIAADAIQIARSKYKHLGDKAQFEAADILTFLKSNTMKFDICIFLGVMDWFDDEENRQIFKLIPAPKVIFSYTVAEALKSKGHLYQRYRDWHRERQTPDFQKMLSSFPRKHTSQEIDDLIDRKQWNIIKQVPSNIWMNPSQIIVADRV